MSTDEKLLLRNKILGILIRDARHARGKTQEECATFSSMSASYFSDIEHGERPISLPELESLGFFLNVPVDHFLGNQLLEQDETKQEFATEELLSLRNRVVGVLLRQARLAASKTQKECAQIVGGSGSKISAYEYGNSPIPVAQLEALADFLQVPLDTFRDKAHNPLSKMTPQDETLGSLSHFAPEVQEFLKEPLNADFVQTALNLSKMPTDQLRNIAETLLEITY